MGLRLDAKRIAELPESLDPNSSFEAGAQLTTELLAGGKSFTALLAYDDVTALGALRALKKKGLRVPEDCSVMGFDDVAQAGLSVAVTDDGAAADGGHGIDERGNDPGCDQGSESKDRIFRDAAEDSGGAGGEGVDAER